MANKSVRKVRRAVTQYGKEFKLSRKNVGQRKILATNIRNARKMSYGRGVRPMKEALGY